jgi:hypothetical protein
MLHSRQHLNLRSTCLSTLPKCVDTVIFCIFEGGGGKGEYEEKVN